MTYSRQQRTIERAAARHITNIRKSEMQPLLPSGEHGGLTIKHSVSRTGPMVYGAGHKIVLHTTEGAGIDGAFSTLVANNDRPHFLLDTHSGECIQMVALDQYAEALVHPANTPETNRAGCIQIEMVGFAAETPKWTAHQYHMVAELCSMINKQYPVSMINDKAFRNRASRVAPDNWLRAHGYFGHEHVPNNDHVDPGAFDIEHLFRSMKSL